jgi:hypothetical protein
MISELFFIYDVIKQKNIRVLGLYNENPIFFLKRTDFLIETRRAKGRYRAIKKRREREREKKREKEKEREGERERERERRKKRERERERGRKREREKERNR